MQQPTPIPPPSRNVWTPEQAREAGRKGAEALKRNRAQGKAPSAKKGRPDRQPARGGFATVTRVAAKTRSRVLALVGTAVVLADEAAAKVVRSGAWSWAEEKLEPFEVKMLTEAIVDTALKYPRVARRLEQAAIATDLAAIPTAVALIALPRLVMHGVVPRGLADQLAPLLDEARRASRTMTTGTVAAEGEPAAPAGPPPAGDVPPDRTAPESPVPGVEPFADELISDEDKHPQF